MLATKRGFAAGGLAAALLAVVGCASGKADMSKPILGPAVDAPDYFRVSVSGLAKFEDPKPGTGCRNPMIDPRDKTLLELRRSANGVGDYWAEAPKYGLKPRTLLRVDCGTGKPLGIVDE